MKIKRLLFYVTVMLLASIFVVSAIPAQTSEKPVVLSYAHFFPPMHLASKEAKDWATKIEERTKGRVKINLYPAGTLIPAAEVYDGTVKGATDIGMHCPAHSPGRFPQHMITNLPLGYPSTRVATLVMNDLYKKFKFKEVADTHVFYWYATGVAQVHSKRPVNTLEDLKGMKISGVGFSAKVCKFLGATPVSIPVSEVYLSLDKGITEGNINPYNVSKGFKIAEVTKYTTEASLTTTSFVIAMNQNKWNALPPDIQKIFEEVSAETLKIIQDDWEADAKEGKEYALSLGNKIITLPPKEMARWRAAVKPMIDEYIAELEAKGLAGREIVNEAFRLVEKYSK